MTVAILDANVPQNVQYAIPLWLRDAQIEANTKHIAARLQPQYEPRLEPCAVVCYGPSLNDTWEKVSDFPVIFTCSGAHRFMIDRSVMPSFHIDVDPRAHKVLLMGQPHPDVEYLMASTVHPAVIDHLEGYKVTLWHVFDSAEEGKRVLPPGEWAIMGGCNVGLRALGIAAFLGFRDLHVFGMDGCEGASGKHAAAHPSQPKDHSITEYRGVTYKTTPAMLEAARGTWHELDQMPGVTATFYGEGLVQAMAQDYVPKAAGTRAIVETVAYRKPTLISPEYVALNAQLHRENFAYGVGGAKHAPMVLKLVDQIKARSVLDYGCGKGELAKALPFGINEYDPAIPGKDKSPRPSDIVICSDVLEHIEPEMLNAVLRDLKRVTLKVGFFVIHTGPAGKTLPDGRNTHLVQKPRKWWQAKLEKYFEVGKIIEQGPLLHVVVGPLAKKAA